MRRRTPVQTAVEATGSFERFVSEVTRVPRLERDEEHELAVRAASGDRPARDALVAANARHVVAIATRYRRYGVPVAELVAEGNVGLCIAADKFEPDRGTRFVTYAGHWIRARIVDSVLRHRSLVGGGAGVFRSKLYFRLHRERARLEARCSDGAERTEALAEHFGRSVPEIEGMLARLDARDVSLDAPIGEDGGESRLERLAHDLPSADDALSGRDERAALERELGEALLCLDPRERRIVLSRAMAELEVSLADLAREFGVSRERARQIEARAHGKLRARLARFQPAA